MFLVLDTNVLISAALGEGSCRKAYHLALEVGELVRSEDTFLELVATLEKPRLQKYLTAKDKIDFLANFLLSTKPFPIFERIEICQDPGDNMFLELAVSCQAKCIVTGDDDLLRLNPFRTIPIISVSNFINQFSPGKVEH